MTEKHIEQIKLASMNISEKKTHTIETIIPHCIYRNSG
jgi:hypothetical protein